MKMKVLLTAVAVMFSMAIMTSCGNKKKADAAEAVAATEQVEEKASCCGGAEATAEGEKASCCCGDAAEAKDETKSCCSDKKAE